jgi:hypothetical protein
MRRRGLDLHPLSVDQALNLVTRVTSGYAARSIDELPSLWDGFAKLVRPGLGVTSGSTPAPTAC